MDFLGHLSALASSRGPPVFVDILAFAGLLLVLLLFRAYEWLVGLRDWYVFCFLGHFLRYLPLSLGLLFLLALLTSLVGEEYGVDKLIWHDDPLRQAANGFALAILALEILFIGYLLWRQDHRLGRAVGR